eukprot:3058481-Lingulodinium_polyedra.AAC.1
MVDDAFWDNGEILACFQADEQDEIEKTSNIFQWKSSYKRKLCNDAAAHYAKTYKKKPTPKAAPKKKAKTPGKGDAAKAPD